MTGYIYLLHFVDRIHHAGHYAGCTTNLRGRLLAHATGRGSVLTKVCLDRDIDWVLGGLWQTTFAQMRRLERTLKNRHNGPAHCQICSPKPGPIPGAIPYPTFGLPFATTSTIIKAATGDDDADVTVRLTSADEPESTMLFIRALMRHDKDALGFIPCGGEGGLNLIHDRGLIAIVSRNGQDVGYAAFTINADADQLTTHQCCVRDDARLLGHGRAMDAFLVEKFPQCRFIVKVRDDLAANEFWTALGYEWIRASKHETSARPINHYARAALIAKEFALDEL